MILLAMNVGNDKKHLSTFLVDKVSIGYTQHVVGI